MADLPTLSAKNETGEYDRFTEFLRKLVAVPHSEIRKQLDKEKKAKLKKKARASSSRVADASPTTD